MVDRDVLRTAGALIAGALAVIFDTTITSIALPTLVDELHSSVSTVQWVSTGYLLSLGVVIPLVAWAQARTGGRRLWLIALCVFTAGSILCSLAWNAASLIAFRVVQGVGGGLMLPLMATLVMQAARGRDLGRTMAIVSLPAVLGPILGPVLGGVILHWLDWRWLFWVNVPFCAVGVVLALRLLPDDPPTGGVRLDLPGLALIAPGIVGLLYGLSNVGDAGGFGRADVLVPVIGGVVLTAGFVWRAARGGSGALVDVRLLRHRPVASSAAMLFLSGASLYGAMLLLPLFFQQARGASVLAAGLLLVPQGVGSLLSRGLTGRLMDSLGARVLVAAGFVLVGLATVPFALAGPHTADGWLLAALLVRGLGLSVVTVPVMAVAFIGLARAEVPHASVLTRIAQQVGGSFGTAVLAVILAATHSFERAFWWAVGFTAIAVVLSLLLPGRQAPAQSRKPTSTEPDAALTR
ncbi:MFS transporter [Virgisporangium aliadipatigenens]|uniref:MFS transporter n=1 Tax=Virgisporangium aliadipatigenens TaxID=741659 RepID=A0A8J3YHA2_9ACTN|nr:MDR family MFS transporter [Virgisporangium aliadipatigenens]GIJ43980.1 MFS transporter [Virgisporangium aliadipatigenens]